MALSLGEIGPPVSDASTVWKFNADGSWTYEFGGGRWIQVEGLVTWNFKNAAGLIYTANVTRNGLDGIMGYAVAGSSPARAPSTPCARSRAASPRRHRRAMI